MVIKYTDKVIKHFMSPLNVGEIENPSGKSIEAVLLAEIWLV